MLEIKDVSAGYGPANVVHDVSLDVRPGEIVTLVGANGAGKSTLAKTISGLVPCRKGTIELSGVRIDRKSTAERMRLGIVHIPEGRQVFSGLSVNENLQLGGYLDRRQPAELARRRSDVLAAFPVLVDRLSGTAGNLSGGQQQMLAIGRGLMSRPKLLILDEPSLGLAPLIVAEIFRLIVRLRERGLSILLSEQNAQQSLGIADRGYVLENGRVALSGSGTELLQSREVVDRYLGVGTGTADPRSSSGAISSQLRGLLDDI
ncbi:MAG TPA: ABC transporter ATP-binding protein [Pseudolabrys sp.]|nr:ABC transporter ATP-binding protein [Pseudolabrys sp.]